MTVTLVFVAVVKYLREVTPYFRKSSALSEIGWTGPSGLSAKDSTIGKSDAKVIPLSLCYLCRNLQMPDLQNRVVELHSPDAKSSIFLRCPDERIAGQWFNALNSCIEALNANSLKEINRILSGTSGSNIEVRHMGWLAEHVGSDVSYWLVI